MNNFNPGHKAILNDLLLGYSQVRPGKMSESLKGESQW